MTIILDKRRRTARLCPQEFDISRSLFGSGAANFQALTVNKQVAAHAAAMLRLFLTHELRYYALYFDQASGTARAKYITPENITPSPR